MENITSENNLNLKKVKARFVLNQGTFLGLTIAVVYYLTHLTGLMDSFIHNLLTWIIYAGFIHVAMVRYRDRFQDGILSYGQGVWIGTRMGIFAGIIVGAYLFFYLKVINPEYLNELLEQMQEAYLEMGFKEDEVEQMSEVFSLSVNPVVFIISGCLTTGFSALIFSLIIAIFQRRKGDSFVEAMKDVE
ncbi:DUF4199 domain-containing protein [Thermophagus sp. OGC60D27]|uniref:DUF4199 domain-containing protein n=1 Tax=Thermophagus sp. OGC60D27 TaxID=3458415 RepID=UPI0040380637